MTYEFKLCDGDNENVYMIDTLEANDIIEAYVKVNEILKNINEKFQDEVKFKLNYIEAVS